MFNAWKPQAGEAPGKQRVYSHACYVLLQLVLERCYGAPIATLFEERILGPIGMNATSLPERGEDNRAVMDVAWMQRVVQGYSDQGMAIGPPGNQQSYFDFPGAGQMFSSPRDLATFVAACVDGRSLDPHLREALRMTQRETFRVDDKFGQGIAWETVHLSDAAIVDKPGGLNNASGYLGLVPAQADRLRPARQSRRISARDRPLQDPARAGEARRRALNRPSKQKAPAQPGLSAPGQERDAQYLATTGPPNL